MRSIIIIIVIFISVGVKSNNIDEKQIRASILDCKISLEKIKDVFNLTYNLAENWVFQEKADDTPLKLELISILDSSIVKDYYDILMQNRYLFPDEYIDKLIDLFISINTITNESKYITKQLLSIDSYDDPLIVFEMQVMFANDGSLTMAIQETNNNIKVLLDYCNYLLEQKKLKPIVKSNYNNKIHLVLDLFELCEIRDEIRNYMLYISPRTRFYGRTFLFEKKIYKRLIYFYYNHFNYDELKEIKTFYDSNAGKKILESNGFLSLRLIDIVVNEELDK